MHFLSRRQLYLVLNPGLELEPTPGDDVESFFLVLIYAVIRSLACSERMRYAKCHDDELDLDANIIQSRKNQLIGFFEQHWGAKSVEEIYQSRTQGSFFQVLLTDGAAGAGSVGEWFLPGGQMLISDALVNKVLIQCIDKFSNQKTQKRFRHRLGPGVTEKPDQWTEDQLFTYDELIKMFQDVLADMNSDLEVEYTKEQEQVAKEQEEAKKQEKAKKSKNRGK